jgi:hypothetical protein
VNKNKFQCRLQFPLLLDCCESHCDDISGERTGLCVNQYAWSNVGMARETERNSESETDITFLDGDTL